MRETSDPLGGAAGTANGSTTPSRLRPAPPNGTTTGEGAAASAAMAAAPMRFQADGSVDWGAMWDTFCALAQAGGPAHRPSMLCAATDADRTEPAYQAAAREIIRGVAAVSGLRAYPVRAGWIAVRCDSSAMAAWLASAILAENVAARADGLLLFVPVGADFRLEREIKSVVTVVAKTTHYWREHCPAPRAAALTYDHAHDATHQHAWDNARLLAPIGGGAGTEEEYVLQTPEFREFVASVLEIVARQDDPRAAIAELRGPFSRLLLSDGWLDPELASPCATGGMGGGIGSYLLYRNAARDLSISSLVLPPGARTPVHDHLAWGLVGLFQGEQFEEVYERGRPATAGEPADLILTERRHLRRGEFYDLIPPVGDIHGVVAANEQPSVSIHLLRNDVGCIPRHRFDLEANVVNPFRSGYVNRPCPGDEAV